MPEGLSLARFQAVLFDVDGTLVDSLGMLVPGLSDTFARYADRRPADHEIRGLIGLPLSRQMGLFQATPPTPERRDEMIEYAINRYELYADRESLFPEAVEALRIIRRAGMRTALVTSKNARELAQFLQRFEAAEAVDETVCASDVHHPKPDPESALLACKRLGVAPERAVMIGDSVYDLRCARAAGVTPIAVAYGSADRATLLAEEPAALFDEAADLLSWVQGSLLQTPCPERS